jgi:hypothetical protein
MTWSAGGIVLLELRTLNKLLTEFYCHLRLTLAMPGIRSTNISARMGFLR